MRKCGESLCRWIWNAGLVVLLGVCAGGMIYYKYAKELPDVRLLRTHAFSTIGRILAADGSVLVHYAEQNRSFVKIDDVPKTLQHAFFAAEDKYFEHHYGFNPFAMARTVFVNVTQRFGKKPAGASTITQQVARNLLLKSNVVSIERKMKELILAWRIENAFSKAEILELYLNDVYLGRGAYGVATAALTYFNKKLPELSVDECAFLAGLPQAPSLYGAFKNSQKACVRRNWVLKRMERCGYIEQDTCEALQQKPLGTQVLVKKAPETLGAFFTEEVRRTLVKTYGASALTRDGVTVKTHLDRAWQTVAEEALFEGVERCDQRQGWHGVLERFDPKALLHWGTRLLAVTVPPEAPKTWEPAVVLSLNATNATVGLRDKRKGTVRLSTSLWARTPLEKKLGPVPKQMRDVLRVGDVVLVSLNSVSGACVLHQIPHVNGAVMVANAKTGNVVAMVGGVSFLASSFNCATQAKRPFGSGVKPFYYLAAFERGMPPYFLLKDEPIEIDWNGGVYAPENMEKRFYGWVSLRAALVHSLNIPSILLGFEHLKLPTLVETFVRFGLVPRANFLEPAPSLAIGSFETTLTHMMGAYAILANAGRAVPLSLIACVEDRRGQDLAQKPSDERVVADPRFVYQTTHVLQDVMRFGTGKRGWAGSPLKNVAGKTGTSSNCSDACFFAYTTDGWVVGVWVGRNDGRPIGPHEGGAVSALPIARCVLERGLRNICPPPFEPPVGLLMVTHTPASYEIFKEEAPVQEPVLDPAFEPLALDEGVV